MIKGRTAQLIFQTVYCTLGFVGCVASLGMILSALIQTAKKNEDSCVSAVPMHSFF